MKKLGNTEMKTVPHTCVQFYFTTALLFTACTDGARPCQNDDACEVGDRCIDFLDGVGQCSSGNEEEGCQSSEDCDFGEFCDLDNKRCEAHPDQQDLCRGCTQNDDCGVGTFCYDENVPSGACTNDSQCGNGGSCTSSSVTCLSDLECGDNGRCNVFSNLCTCDFGGVSCPQDSVCPPNAGNCIASKCVSTVCGSSECTEGSCPRGYECSLEVDVAPCPPDSDCPEPRRTCTPQEGLFCEDIR